MDWKEYYDPRKIFIFGKFMLLFNLLVFVANLQRLPFVAALLVLISAKGNRRRRIFAACDCAELSRTDGVGAAAFASQPMDVGLLWDEPLRGDGQVLQ